MSSSEYRITGRFPAIGATQSDDAQPRTASRVPRVAAPEPVPASPFDLPPLEPLEPPPPAGPLGPLGPSEGDLAMTRAPTEPIPADTLAHVMTRAVGTDPPPTRARLPADRVMLPPARAPEPAPVRSTDAPSARMVTFGTTTLLLVPAGDRIALVIPGVMRLTGTRDEALALAAALAAPPARR